MSIINGSSEQKEQRCSFCLGGNPFENHLQLCRAERVEVCDHAKS